MARFRCIECGAEFEVDMDEKEKRCPECKGCHFEYLVGKSPAQQSREASWKDKKINLKF